MANELKPCPFCGGVDKVKCTIFMSVFQVQCFECKSSAYGSNNKDQAIAAWNTRPAAPVEELETVGYVPSEYGRQLDFQGLGISRLYKNEGASGQVAVVTRSQAEAIIAAERARYHALEEIAAGLVERTDKAEAQLSETRKVLERVVKYSSPQSQANSIARAALEAKP